MKLKDACFLEEKLWPTFNMLVSILKSRDITLPTEVHLVRAMIFPVAKYGCESWTIKKAEHWRIDSFELWCWRKLLRVSWTTRSPNPSVLEEISPKCSLEGLMLKLKLQYFGYLIWKTDSLEKTLMLEKIESRRKRGWQWLDGITDSVDEFEQAPGVGDGQINLVSVLQSMGSQRLTEQLNWTESRR